MEKKTVSIIAEDSLLRGALKRKVLPLGLEVHEAARVTDLTGRFETRRQDLIIIVSSGSDAAEGLQAAREIRRHDQRTPLVLITRQSSEELAIEALKSGVTDYLKMPFPPEDLQASLKRHLSSTATEPRSPSPTAAAEDNPEQIVGQSLAITRIIGSLGMIAAADCTVLITGETGTGKELAANYIHRHSARAQKPFGVINCAAIPDTLLESELFGHEKGAFTGAFASRGGALLSANHGTIFFDEIGDMSPYAQAKILRALENKEILPVGGTRNIPLAIRFVAATNRDLEKLVREGKFRSDLYFRLNVSRIILPPLRERKEDIPLLLDHFRKMFNRQFGKNIRGYADEAMAAIMSHDWPGNIRELKNLLESSFITAYDRITLKDFPELFCKRLQKSEDQAPFDEKARLLHALSESNWNKTKAAQQLNWSRMTLYRKLEKYCLLNEASLGHQ